MANFGVRSPLAALREERLITARHVAIRGPFEILRLNLEPQLKSTEFVLLPQHIRELFNIWKLTMIDHIMDANYYNESLTF